MIILKILKNKYFLTILGVFIWVLFFDKNDFFSQLELINKCKDLKKEKEYYISEIKIDSAQISLLKTNAEALETFAREKYLMKSENEDVFVVVAK
ncbi:MAG: septum formation initiator family protein [Bacteroidetes bacterium]|nr:septum formation initiator family protein [Bacteroidota bacterium]